MTSLLDVLPDRAPRRGRRRGRRAPWVVLLVVGAVLGLGGPVWLDARAAARYPVTAEEVEAGRAALAELPVKGRAPRTGYEREEFGQRWADTDRNGCDTRNDVLARDLVDVTTKPGTRECVVLTGTLHDVYTGTTIAFERGERSSQVQVDHVVALADAWQKGAQGWTPEQRERFANDPANLQAVQGRANQQKGAGDAATWLPPEKGYRCVYALRQVAVKHGYGLWVTRAERDALAREIDRCAVVPAR